ncbi:ABC transporter ATP-binding protein [Streptomyces sp. NBC_01618]|uniref:ABC transporter ATP-binding protein n=1 Tax=Streptomyces sp. NBC_01618 TaxID=2975900 RepID=UPI003869DD2A|nr:ABC transporter ATP-binding protein [Streptomyces sp. NBC_01618]
MSITSGLTQTVSPTSPGGQSLAVNVTNVTHNFLLDKQGDTRAIEALHDVNLEVTDGQFVALVGPSGCGKTTLLNMVAGLLTPHTGTIDVLGQPPKSGRRDIAYMLARDALLPWRTAMENVMFGLEVRNINDRQWREERAREMLSLVGLEGFHDAYRTELSQGMRQRVALARTFALPSDVLLMDEPFGALDPQRKIQLGQVLLGLWEKEPRTILFVTHDLHEAIALADRVIVMNPRPGHIAEDVPIGLPRPRSIRDLQTDAEFHALYSRIWEVLNHD